MHFLEPIYLFTAPVTRQCTHAHRTPFTVLCLTTPPMRARIITTARGCAMAIGRRGGFQFQQEIQAVGWSPRPKITEEKKTVGLFEPRDPKNERAGLKTELSSAQVEITARASIPCVSHWSRLAPSHARGIYVHCWRDGARDGPALAVSAAPHGVVFFRTHDFSPSREKKNPTPLS